MITQRIRQPLWCQHAHNNLDIAHKRRFNVECKQRVRMKKLFFGHV
jgi:hypothetical protein